MLDTLFQLHAEERGSPQQHKHWGSSCSSSTGSCGFAEVLCAGQGCPGVSHAQVNPAGRGMRVPSIAASYFPEAALKKSLIFKELSKASLKTK